MGPRIVTTVALALAIVPAALADGGTLQLAASRGGLRISVFTSPNPLRVGPADVSVLLQDEAAGKLAADIPVVVRAFPVARPEDRLEAAASRQAATNKLFQSAILDLPIPGRWRFQIEVQTPDGPPPTVEVEAEVLDPVPSWLDLAIWIGWPLFVIPLFLIHVLRARRGGLSKKAGPFSRFPHPRPPPRL